jgi:predicted nucleic acid-binding protein
VIVSDASPIIVLLKTNNLSILKDLFEKIAVPTAVYKEITAKEQEKIIFDKIDWIETRKIKNTQENVLLEKLIDKGEAEAIILAKELKTSLLVDDAKARKYAILLNVEVIGTLGLLKMAKKRGIISSVKKTISDMLAEGYYIEDKLIARILEDVGES